MRPQPFPRPGEHLVDPPRPFAKSDGERRRPVSVFGGVGYAPGHPSRWAGSQGSGTTRLTVEGDVVLLEPFRFWRVVNRLPVVRIPIGQIATASRTTFGIRFAVPGDPALDGTRFLPFGGDSHALEPLIELLQDRGIPVDTMPVSSRLRGYVRDHAVAGRPGWIWRDRRFGIVESALGLALGLGVLYLLGFFSKAPAFFLGALAFVVALNVWGWVAGHRRRRKALAEHGDGGRLP